MSNQSDIAVLFPARELTVRGENLTLKPFTFGELARVTRYVAPIARSLLASGIMTVIPPVEGSTNATIKIDPDFVPKLFGMLEDASEPLMELIAFAVKQERSWLNEVPADEGITLATQLWEVNADFFVKRVMPLLPAKMFSASPSTGETSSLDSSVPGIAEATSTATA